MKNKFNFLQISNWIYISLIQIKNFNLKNKNEQKEILLQQKKIFMIIKEVLLKKRQLYGINLEFLKNLKEIKKEYGIHE